MDRCVHGIIPKEFCSLCSKRDKEGYVSVEPKILIRKGGNKFMDVKEISEAIQSIFTDILDFEQPPSLDTKIEHLYLDELETALLLLTFEEIFDINIGAENFDRYVTIQELITAVGNKIIDKEEKEYYDQ